MSTLPETNDSTTLTLVCNHLELRWDADLDAYECANPRCRRLFERIERSFCRVCRKRIDPGWEAIQTGGDLCNGCWQDEENERSERHWAEVRRRERAIPCPHCGVAATRACKSPSGARTETHKARKAAAR